MLFESQVGYCKVTQEALLIAALCNVSLQLHQTLTWIATSLLNLQRWRDLVIESDPDIIIGYNIVNFDLPYLIERAETLDIKEFPFWGRLTRK